LHYIPHLTLAPHNGFFPEMVTNRGKKVTIGRKNDDPLNPPQGDFFAYNSRVVSRLHAEIWFVGHCFHIRDLRSTSGTFLNAMRLSEPGKESRPFKIVSGDVVQFGVDLRKSDREEEKCVCAVAIVRKIPLSLKQLSIRVVRASWHIYTDQQLKRLPLSLEREVLNVPEF
jgi:pSer/pThr/pTyr-binding forkhead associated (FHA) protein